MAKGPKVTGEGDYSEAGHGPETDAAAFNKMTPFGAPDGHDQDPGNEDGPQYVFDETEKKATPPGMLSRSALRTGDEAGSVEKEEGGNALFIGGAIAAFLVLVVLGILGIVSNNKQLAAIDEQAEAAAASKPVAPDDVQGVKVRKGMKHRPAAPAKTPGKTLDNAEPVELNAVPDGAPPPDVTPEELEAPSDDVPDPGGPGGQ